MRCFFLLPRAGKRQKIAVSARHGHPTTSGPAFARIPRLSPAAALTPLLGIGGETAAPFPPQPAFPRAVQKKVDGASLSSLHRFRSRPPAVLRCRAGKSKRLFAPKARMKSRPPSPPPQKKIIDTNQVKATGLLAAPSRGRVLRSCRMLCRKMGGGKGIASFCPAQMGLEKHTFVHWFMESPCGLWKAEKKGLIQIQKENLLNL